MDPKNIRLYGGNGTYFIEDQYQKDYNSCCGDNNSCYKDTIFGSKDTIFDYKDAYYYYDVDVNRILLYKKVTMNILLDTKIQIKSILYHYN